MIYDGNESRDIKAENPLTPKPDNAWMEALPIKNQPWIGRPTPTTQPADDRTITTAPDNSPASDSESWWKCPKCGGSNMPSFRFCYGCDLPRPDHSPASLPESSQTAAVSTCKVDVLGNLWLVCKAPATGPCMCDVVVKSLPDVTMLPTRIWIDSRNSPISGKWRVYNAPNPFAETEYVQAAAVKRLVEAGNLALEAFRYLRDKDTMAWDLSVTPEVCTAWDKLRAALRELEGEGK